MGTYAVTREWECDGEPLEIIWPPHLPRVIQRLWASHTRAWKVEEGMNG